MEDPILSYDPPPEYASHLLATIQEVAARAGGTIITQEEIDLAYSMILSASLEAIRVGSASWTAASVPIGVRAIVAQAATRGYLNPEGYDREGNEGVTFGRGDHYVEGADLTASEQRQIKAMAGRSGFIAVPASKPSHWNSRADAERQGSTWWVPWTEQVGRKPFPFGSDDEFRGA